MSGQMPALGQEMAADDQDDYGAVEDYGNDESGGDPLASFNLSP